MGKPLATRRGRFLCRGDPRPPKKAVGAEAAWAPSLRVAHSAHPRAAPCWVPGTKMKKTRSLLRRSPGGDGCAAGNSSQQERCAAGRAELQWELPRGCRKLLEAGISKLRPDRGAGVSQKRSRVSGRGDSVCKDKRMQAKGEEGATGLSEADHVLQGVWVYRAHSLCQQRHRWPRAQLQADLQAPSAKSGCITCFEIRGTSAQGRTLSVPLSSVNLS